MSFLLNCHTFGRDNAEYKWEKVINTGYLALRVPIFVYIQFDFQVLNFGYKPISTTILVISNTELRYSEQE
jgi:hypothetical protein